MPVKGVRTSWANTASAASTTPRDDGVGTPASRDGCGIARADVTWGERFLSSLVLGELVLGVLVLSELALSEPGLSEALLGEFVFREIVVEFAVREFVVWEFVLADSLPKDILPKFDLGKPEAGCPGLLPGLADRAWRPPPRFRTRLIMALLT
ncbi:hypothetical protein BRAS3843_1560013 [Bradyrhizobium sp. STM 3843]|nr:hypothetical protein BRAS3843_1560013 [Bradyrhizobium sp. STM 3843]